MFIARYHRHPWSVMRENGDIHAVVLAGPGHRLYPLVDESATATSPPKATIPIANRPMICWTVEWLLESGVGAVTVVVEGRAASKISHILNKAFASSAQSPPIDMLIMEEHVGTMGVLKEVGDRVSMATIVLVVPCDFVTNRSSLLSEMADKHRTSNSLLTALLVPDILAIPNAADDEVERGDAVVVAFDVKSDTLVQYSPKTDITDGPFCVQTSTLLAHPHMIVHSDLIDVHCYFFKKALFSHEIFSSPDMYSFREEALPNLVQIVNHSHSDIIQPFIFSADCDRKDVYCFRANCIPLYLLANCTLARLSTANRCPQTTEIPPRSQLSNDSLIGEHCRLGERSSIKKSVIGSHVIIGSNVKISNSVILDNVVIGDGVKLDGCVIASKVFIKEKAHLRECEVAASFVVESDLVAKGEVLGTLRELSNMFE